MQTFPRVARRGERHYYFYLCDNVLVTACGMDFLGHLCSLKVAMAGKKLTIARNPPIFNSPFCLMATLLRQWRPLLGYHSDR
jgi:hypothetical protein